MTRSKTLILIFAMVLAGTMPATVPAQGEYSGNDREFAERVPLAAHSLLLDTIRVDNRILAVGERGHVVYSDDDGESWLQAEVVPTRSTLTALAASGDRLWAAGHDSVILSSEDGGVNWALQYFDPDRQQPVMDLHFFDGERGLAIGAYGLVLVTGDGGESWEDWAVNDEDDAHLNSLVELADGTLLIAGEAGFSYRSLDQGESWETLDLPYQGSMFRALETRDGCVLFVGLRGHAMQSCDAGESWEEVDTGSETTIIDGAVSGDRVLLVGNGGMILDRSGGGEFSPVTHSSGVDFASILDLGGGKFLLTGEDGMYYFPESSAEDKAP